MEANNYAVSYSDKITQSRFVHNSVNVDNSSNVSNSQSVNNSNLIFNSNFISDSTKVSESSNINDSHNIVLSNSVFESINIFNSFDICESSELLRCKNVSTSYFCSDCSNIKNSIFCFNLNEDLENNFYLFNKPIDEKRFGYILKRYKQFKFNLHYTNDWPEEIVVPITLRSLYNFNSHYETVPPEFWDWAKTLPNYDPMILYNITMNPLFLK